MKNEKELKKTEIEKLGFSEKEIDAMFESIFYEDRIIFKNGMYQLKSLTHSNFFKDINCLTLAAVKNWIKENIACNDAYHNALND